MNDKRMITVDSFEITELELGMYVTKKMLECGFDVSRSGFKYIREILSLMLAEPDAKKPMCVYYKQVASDGSSVAKIDKAVGAAIEMSLACGGLKALDEFMCGAISRKHTTASVLCALKEYIRYSLYMNRNRSDAAIKN